MKEATASRRALFPIHPLALALVCIGAFAVYWSSSFILDTPLRDGRMQFGADTLDFAPLANGEISNRNLRLHPLTIALSLAWLKAVSPLTAWLEPAHLHRALFALIGALGVWTALSAFAALVERKYVALLGVIYASSLGIWYFASIEESKILTATLASLYIAVYLHVRAAPTRRDLLLLSLVLFAACLNEIVAAFLVAIPATDFFLRYGFDLRKSRWIFLHALIPPATLLLLEFFVNGVIAAPTDNPENASHVSMFFYYLVREHSLAAAYIYVINWFCFSIAAPAPEADYLFSKWPLHPYYFEPTLSNYFNFLPQAAIAIAFFVIAAGALLALWKKNAEPGFVDLPARPLSLCARALPVLLLHPSAGRPAFHWPSYTRASSAARRTVLRVAFAGETMDSRDLRAAPDHRQRPLHHRPCGLKARAR